MLDMQYTKKYKIIYEIMDDKVYILRVIHHSQNITNNFFLQKMKSLMCRI